MTYAGDISCSDCWKVLIESADAQLIDVRTSEEWCFVGLADLSRINRQPLLVEWQKYPEMHVNPAFVESVEMQLADLGMTRKDINLFTLCRSGIRSIAAAEALTRAGYSKVMNVCSGFEGGPDKCGQRGTVSGWKVEGLPWRQN